MREFRDHQLTYLRMLEKGDDIVLKSRGIGSFKLSLLSKDDTLITKEELSAKIEKGIREFKEGKGKVINSREELFSYLDSL
jgi:hypothetical protein